jgi:hypothetical protein
MSGLRVLPGTPGRRLVSSRLLSGLGKPERRGAPQDSFEKDAGRALIEVVFLAVLILIPTVYILASVLRIQAATFAVAQGARDAGRVMDSAPSVAVGVARAEEIARLALTDQRVPADGMRLRFVRPGSDCVSAPEIPPSLSRGDVYDVCVVAVVSFPGVPTVVTGTQNTVTGVFTLHVGDFREGT